mgnify:CR=1 FL=1
MKKKKAPINGGFSDLCTFMKLTRDFYTRSTLIVAPELLGKYLVHVTALGKISGEINEVEAYLGSQDPASHAFRGPTLRSRIMFEEGGLSYIYFTYGKHFCMNVTTEKSGTAGGVLIRSVIPVEGREMMKKNRGVNISLENLANGPGKICQAFGLSKEENGADLTQSETLYIEDRGRVIPVYETSPRIGISQAKEAKWRFFYSPNV